MPISITTPFSGRNTKKTERKTINPWSWQNRLGYSQAVSVRNNSGRTLYCSGQAAMDTDGRPVAESMQKQVALCLGNLERVIRQAEFGISEIVRINFYTTAIDEFFASYGEIVAWMQQHQVNASSTLVQASALAFPGLKVEIEATLAG